MREGHAAGLRLSWRRLHDDSKTKTGCRVTQGALKSRPGEGAGRFGGSIRATLWPTRAFAGGVRWFDELYVWTEGAAPTVTQRARIQINALRDAFKWLEFDLVEQVGVT